MKFRKILIVLLLCSLGCLSACNDAKQEVTLSGRYVLVDISDDPEETTFTQIEEMYQEANLKLSDYLYIDLLPGNRFIIVLFGEEEASGSYSEESGILKLISAGETLPASLTGGKITWVYENGAKLIFERK